MVDSLFFFGRIVEMNGELPEFGLIRSMNILCMVKFLSLPLPILFLMVILASIFRPLRLTVFAESATRCGFRSLQPREIAVFLRMDVHAVDQ
jgi:hypothetical protein